MKNGTSILIKLAAACLMFRLSATGAETVIYFDSFNGPPQEVLNGRVPEITLEDGICWQAGETGSPWKADGTIALQHQACNAFLPFRPQPGKTYSLSLNMRPEGPLGEGFLALGFASTNTFDEVFTANEKMAVSPWMFVNNDWIINPRSWLKPAAAEEERITRTYRTYCGPGNVGGIPPKEAVGEWIAVEMILNTRDDMWEMQWFVNDERVRIHRYVQNPVIHYVALGRFRKAAGTVDRFKLAVISDK